MFAASEHQRMSFSEENHRSVLGFIQVNSLVLQSKQEFHSLQSQNPQLKGRGSNSLQTDEKIGA